MGCQPVSQRAFAKRLGWTVARLNELINGKRGINLPDRSP